MTLNYTSSTAVETLRAALLRVRTHTSNCFYLDEQLRREQSLRDAASMDVVNARNVLMDALVDEADAELSD